MRQCDYSDCRNPLHKVLLCTKCKGVAYCSKDCQTKAWKAGHARECAPGQGASMAAQSRSAVQRAAHTETSMTADQRRLLTKLDVLQASRDWRGVVAMEHEAKAVTAAVRAEEPDGTARVCCILGIAYCSLGDFSKALEYHAQHLVIAKELADRAGEGRAYANLGIACRSRGDLAKAIEYHTQELAIAKEVGDYAGEGRAYANLGNAYDSLGAFSIAIEYHTQHLAIAKEAGNRAEEGMAYGNLGSAYQALGDFCKAIRYHTQRLAITKEVGDWAGEGGAYGNLGNAYQSLGDFDKAIEYHTQDLAIAIEVGNRVGEGMTYGNLGNAYHSLGDFGKAIECSTQDLFIAKEVGDRSGEGRAYNNLGLCHLHLGEYVKAVTYLKAQYAMGMELGLTHMLAQAAMGMGVALRLEVQADRQSRQGHAAGASQAPWPHGDPSALAYQDDRVDEAARSLQAALDGGHASARLHLAHLTFEAGQEDAGLAHLKEHLSWLVQRGRDTCAGCGQTRGEDAPMLTCSGCRVARFCSADHQKMASKKAALGGSLIMGRHKDICGVLGKWREVVKDGVLPDSCRQTWWGSYSDEFAMPRT